MDETDQVNSPRIASAHDRPGTWGIFLAGGSAGLVLGLVIGLIFARSITAAVRSLRLRMTTDEEPHFEFLAQ